MTMKSVMINSGENIPVNSMHHLMKKKYILGDWIRCIKGIPKGNVLCSMLSLI